MALTVEQGKRRVASFRTEGGGGDGRRWYECGC
jgi:hypothetical protein